MAMTGDERLYESLSRQIDALAESRKIVKARILKARSPFAVGDMIAWGDKRGRVESIGEWAMGPFVGAAIEKLDSEQQKASVPT